MRLLRELSDEQTARLVEDALYQRGIESNVSPSQSGTFLIWVVDEEQLARASELANGWLDEGREGELKEIASRGRHHKDERERQAAAQAQQLEAAKRVLSQAMRPRPTPLTWGLVGLCVAIYLLSGAPGFSRDTSEQLASVLRALAIVDPALPQTGLSVTLLGAQVTLWSLPFSEPWRFVTPVLVHHDLLHLGFNMLVLLQLGRVLEMRHGSRTLFAITLVAGTLSNIAQYEITGNPLFAGFSGVVYALLGFLWIRGRSDPTVGYRLSQGAVSFMLVWLAFGFIGGIGGLRIANYCHLFGLLVGMAWGYASAKKPARR